MSRLGQRADLQQLRYRSAQAAIKFTLGLESAKMWYRVVQSYFKRQTRVELLSMGSAYRRAPPACNGFYTKSGIKSLKYRALRPVDVLALLAQEV